MKAPHSAFYGLVKRRIGRVAITSAMAGLALLLFTTTCFAKNLEKVSGKQLYKTTLGEDNDEVIVGDEKSAEFKPQFTVKIWKNPQTGEYENSLTLKIPDNLITNKIPLLTGNKLEVKDAKTGFYFESQDDGVNCKFGQDFYEKPSSNRIIYQLENWQEYDFLYQDTLENDWKADPKGQTLQDYLATHQRPDNVVFSYSIRHKWKKDFFIGKTNYQTGKVLHDYRVKYIDANGWWVWCDTEYDLVKGQRIVIIPLDFWNNAKYPIRANDTFGKTAIGASNDSSNTNCINANKYTPASSGTCSNIKICAWDAGGNSHVKMAFYTDHNGTDPDTLVDNSSTGAITVTQTTKPTIDAQWTVGSQTGSVTGSTPYWLSFDQDDSTVYLAYDSGSAGVNQYQVLAYASFPPATYPSPTVDGIGLYSIYAIYTTGGEAAVAFKHPRSIGVGIMRGVWE